MVRSFKSKKFRPQYFPFKQTLTNYIFKNADSELYKKLNQSCKYFFVKVFIIENFLFINYIPSAWHQMRRYKFTINHVKRLKYLSNNLWLTDKFVVDCWSDTFYEILMPKIFRCEIKELTIKNSPNLPFKYFKFLTESGTVKNLKLYKTEIFCSNDETDLMAFDEILECIPSANTVSIDPCRILSKNMSEFEIINRKTKFEKIELFRIVSSRLGLLDFLMENVENWDKNYKNIKIEFQDPDENNGFESDFSSKVYVQRTNEFFIMANRMISKLEGMEIFIQRPRWCQKSKYARWFI